MAAADQPTAPVSSAPSPPFVVDVPFSSSDSPTRGYLKFLFETFEYVLPSSAPTPPSLLLGRKLPFNPNNVLPISYDRNISRVHARIWWVGEERAWYVECLGKNGMFVDDVFMAGMTSQRLQWTEDEYIKMQVGDVIFFIIQPSTPPQV